MRETSSHIGDKKPTTHLFPSQSEIEAVNIFGLNFPHLLQMHSFSFHTLEEAYNLAEYIATFLQRKIQKKVELGLKEIFFNAIEHGNLGISFDEKTQLKNAKRWLFEFKRRSNQYADKKVDVLLEITPSHISIKVKDEGEGFDWRELDTSENFVNTSLHGRGLILAKHLCFDRLEFSEKGNEVSCIVYVYNPL